MIKELKQSSYLSGGQPIESVVNGMDTKRKRDCFGASSSMPAEEPSHKRSIFSMSPPKNTWSSAFLNDGDFDEEIALVNAYRSRFEVAQQKPQSRLSNDFNLDSRQCEDEEEDDDQISYISPVSSFHHPTIMRARTICDSPPTLSDCFSNDPPECSLQDGEPLEGNAETSCWRYADEEQILQEADAEEQRDGDEERHSHDERRNDFFIFNSAERITSPSFLTNASLTCSTPSQPFLFRVPPMHGESPVSSDRDNISRFVSLDWEASLARAVTSTATAAN